MNKYIIITPSIYSVGGLELFVSGKAEYLEKKGWEVVVLHSDDLKNVKCGIAYLQKYIKTGCFELSYPPFMYPQILRDKVLDKLCRLVGEVEGYEKIYLESHADSSSQWGELLAERIHAKHVFLICNEYFRGPNRYYENCMDFYIFKHSRKEIAGEVPNEMQIFFDGYKNIPENERYIFELDEDPVRDYKNPKIEALKKYDANICYIGRSSKVYVRNILKDVGYFCKMHPEKRIQLIMLGNAEVRKQEISIIKEENKNLIVTELGDVVPIPRSLFSKVDVVIAGSGSANCAVHEGVPVILADPNTKQSNGLLGYETKNFLFSDGNTSKTFYESLEDVFLRHLHKELVFDYPPRKGPAYCQEQNFKLFEADIDLEYCDKRLLFKSKPEYGKILMLYLKHIYHRFKGI